MTMIKRFVPALIALLLLAGCAAPTELVVYTPPGVSAVSGATQAAAAPAPQEEDPYRMVSMEEAVTMMEEESGYIILDVRTPEEFGDKHIPDAINVPNETIGAAEILELPDKDQLILVYCRSGNRSKQASAKLAALGYTNVVEFGGINSWPGEVVSGS